MAQSYVETASEYCDLEKRVFAVLFWAADSARRVCEGCGQWS